MISTKQAQALRLQCTKALGMSESDYRGMLGEYGVSSSKQLETTQYHQLMKNLKGRQTPQNPKGYTTADKQMSLIYYLWGELYKIGRVKHKTNSACLHWMRKYLVQPDGIIEFTPYQKSRCIERLKKWLERD